MTWLTGWQFRKELNFAGAAAAATDYNVFIKIYRTNGTDSSEDLTGGHNGVKALKVFVKENCKGDFGDIRFTDNDGVTPLSYFRDSYTQDTSALFAVKVADDLGNPGVDTPFYMYYGNGHAVTTSSASNTFRRIISSGVVLALPMNEGVDVTCEDYSGNGYDGTITDATWVDTGKFGTALNFDGAGNDKVNCGATSNLQVSASILVWVNPDIVNDWMQMSVVTKRAAANNRAYSTGITNLGKFRGEFWDNGGNNIVWASADDVNVSAHNMLTITHNGTQGRTYVNGVYQNDAFAVVGIDDTTV